MRKLRIYGLLGGGAVIAVAAFSLGATNRDHSQADVSEAEKLVPAKISYNWDVAPILSSNCFRCHGNDAGKRKAGLRLDVAANAYAPVPEHKAHRAIVPRNPGASELIRRITSSDPDVRMPPKETHKVFSPVEIATLTRWIEQGAEYEEHWSYIPPKIVAPQHTEFDKQAVNNIDRYIYARIQKAGLRPSLEADRETLINRVALDNPRRHRQAEDLAAGAAGSVRRGQHLRSSSRAWACANNRGKVILNDCFASCRTDRLV
jgi:hypothetical protein